MASGSSAKRTLLDEVTDASAPTPSPRKLHRVNTDEAAAKSIRDNFKEFTSMETDGKKIGGVSLREQLKHDKRLNREDPKRHPMGAKYYAGMRQKYSSEVSPAKQLHCKDDSLQVGAQLLKAMVAWKGQSCNRQPMVGYLQVAEAPNQKELVGILKCFLELKPSSSPEQLRCSLDIMRWFHRLELRSRFKDEYQIVKESFDRALVQAHVSAKKTFAEPQTFISIHRAICSLVMPIDSVDRIISETGEWANVKTDLHEVCKSKLGMRLFGFALSLVSAQSLQQLLASEVQMLMQKPSLESADLQAFQKALVEKAMALPGLDTLPERRIVQVLYRGVKMQLKVSSTTEEIELRLWAAVKSHAVVTKQLQALFCEDDLAADGPAPSKVTKLAAEILVPSREARRLANSSLPEGSGKDGETIKDLLVKKEAALTSIDRTFKIEQMFMADMVGVGGATRLQDAFLQILPSKENAKSLELVLQAASSLMASDLFKFCSKEAQASIQAASENLSGMIQGKPCSIQEDSSSFLLKVREGFQFFCRHAEKGKPEKVGSEAAVAKFRGIQAKDVQTITFDELEPVQLFAYLLPPKEQSDLDDITAKMVGLLDSGAVGGKGAKDAKAKKPPVPKASGATASKASSSTAGAGSTDIDAALAMFK